MDDSLDARTSVDLTRIRPWNHSAVADVDKVIAQMAENGAIPKGTSVSPDLYLLPQELGGLAR